MPSPDQGGIVKYWHIVLAGVLAFIVANILMVHP
jgi:hypothetical protein